MDLSLFLGRFHLVLVHLPIGLLLLAVVVFFLSKKERFKKLEVAVAFTLLLGSLSAILAAICGWLLANESGYADQTLFLHRWLGIGLSILAGFCWMMKTNKIKTGKSVFNFSMAILAFMVFYTGHLGGNLTHGEGYFLQYAPAALKSVFGASQDTIIPTQQFSDPDSTYVFNDLLLPFLKEKCSNCHDEKNKKGGLDLTTKEGFLKGGEHDKIIMAGNASGSEIFERVTLSRRDKKYMPPKGDALSYDQIRLLEWLINNGASFEKSVSEYDLPKDIEIIFTKIYGLETGRKSFVETLKVSPTSDLTFQNLETNKFKVTRLAANNNLLEISLQPGVKKITKDQMETLLKAKEQITWLNLGDTEILDDHLRIINKFFNLTRLRLEHTSISDQGIVLLAELPHLESLNVYGTKITDESVASFIKMPELKNVYLWQTKISPRGLEQLKINRPELEVVSGLELSKENSPPSK